jgi:hypothetical protein
VVKQPAEVFQGVGDALEKMSATLVKAAKAVGSEGLHDTDVNVGVVVAQEGVSVELNETGKPVEIMIEELLAEVGREIGFGIVQERGDVVLESAVTAALIIHEKGIAVAQQDVAGLEVAVEKVIAGSVEEEFGEAGEVFFKSVFVEGDAGKAQEIVFEIVEVPGDGLAVEAGDGIADTVIQIAAGFDLEARKDSDDFAIGLDDLGSNVFAGTILGKELEKRGVAEVFFEIGAVGKIFGVNFGNGKAVAAKMFGKFEEGGVLFANSVKDSDGAVIFVGEADDFTAGTAQLAL